MINFSKTLSLPTAMFNDNWKEEDGKPLTMRYVNGQDYDEETVQNFIDFIYEGKLDDKSKLNTQLLGISHQYQVPNCSLMSKIISQIPSFKNRSDLSFSSIFFTST